MARPRSDLSALVVGHLQAGGPLTARELAHQLQMAVPFACNVLHRMHVRGELEVVHRVRVPQAKRPVAVYTAPGRAGEPSPAWELLQGWPR
jgi:hypothetical protein